MLSIILLIASHLFLRFQQIEFFQFLYDTPMYDLKKCTKMDAGQIPTSPLFIVLHFLADFNSASIFLEYKSYYVTYSLFSEFIRPLTQF